MKKLLMIFFASFFFVSIIYIMINKEVENDIELNHQEGLSLGSSTSASESPVASGDGTNEIKSQKENVVKIIDETGRNQRLKLGAINTNDVGEYLVLSNPTACYSQISEGHYYFMRSDGNGNYTIYRDKGEQIGQFSVDDKCYIEYFGKIKDNYYAILTCEKENEDGEYLDATYKLVSVDIEKGTIMFIKNISDEHTWMTNSRMYLCVYQNAFYYDECNSVWHSTVYDRLYIPGELKCMNREGSETIIESTNFMNDAKPCLTFMDGKIYYGSQYGDKKSRRINLFSYDLENGREERIFSFERETELNTKGYGLMDQGKFNLSIDEDYIYCQDYIIPRRGGEMKRVFEDALLYDDSTISFTYNSKYIFYVDNKYRVRRVDKKNLKNIVISEKKSMDVKCTETDVYVRAYKEALLPGYWDDTTDAQLGDDPNSNDIYCMDMNGKSVEKICRK